MRYYVPALAPIWTKLEPIAFTLLRVMAGVAFVAHGFPKISDPMSVSGMVGQLGFAPAAFWAYALAITEFFGGIALILGLFTRFAALATSVILVVTSYTHWVLWAQGYTGAELSLIWLSVTLYLVTRGGGRYSVDAAIGREL